MVQTRISKEKYPALGYTSNLDILCDFHVDVLNQLLQKHLPNADLTAMEVPNCITVWYGTREHIAQVNQLPLSEKGVQNLSIVAAAFPIGDVVLVPSKYIDKPKYTIGLGDSFVAGVQICFSK